MRSDLGRAVSSLPRGCLETKQSKPFAMRDWNTRHACARYVISVRESTFPARTLVYSVHNNWRRAISRSWNAALFRLLKTNPLLRISIHPPDYFQPTIWKQILKLHCGYKKCADHHDVSGLDR